MRLELNQLTKKGQGLATDETANASAPRTLSVGCNFRAGGAPGGAGIVKSVGPLPHSAVCAAGARVVFVVACLPK
jgi:hypothetical protein